MASGGALVHSAHAWEGRDRLCSRLSGARTPEPVRATWKLRGVVPPSWRALRTTANCGGQCFNLRCTSVTIEGMTVGERLSRAWAGRGRDGGSHRRRSLRSRELSQGAGTRGIRARFAAIEWLESSSAVAPYALGSFLHCVRWRTAASRPLRRWLGGALRQTVHGLAVALFRVTARTSPSDGSK